nr:RHS repeat protein [Bacteroidota bacterium]
MKKIYISKQVLILLLFGSLFNYNAHADVSPDDPFFTPSILPPSPTASELGKYGQIPVGMFTGTPNIDIPLYSFKTKNLSVPISLSYSSNGIKVDQVASWVGLGWSLNAGGVITRTVRGQPDDKFDRWIMDNVKEFTPQLVQFLDNAAAEMIDTEPDLFAFNFCGFSGKFILNNDLKPVIIPYQDINIDFSFAAYGEYTTFTITTQDGVQYIFGGDANHIETSKTNQSGIGCTKNFEANVETAWYLKSIVHPLGDVINFNYASKTGSYLSGLNQTISKNINYYGVWGCPGATCGAGETRTCAIDLDVKTVHLTKISSPNTTFGSIVFSSSTGRNDHFDVKLDHISIRNQQNEEIRQFDFNYIFSDNIEAIYFNDIHTFNDELKHRMFLDFINIKDKLGTDVQKYSFDYDDMDGLPARLSYAQDHWGYFNGQPNEYFVPAPEEDVYNVFNDIGGDRDPRGAVSGKGLLTKIAYPTGGYNVLKYEPNMLWGSETIYPNRIVETVEVTGTGLTWINASTSYVTLPYTQYVEINAYIQIDTTNFQYMSQHHYGALTIYDIDESEYIYQNLPIRLNEPIDAVIQLTGEHQYELTVEATGEVVTTTLHFRYYYEDPQINYLDVETGGQRIKRVESYDLVKETSEIMQYHYYNTGNPVQSSGRSYGIPDYYSVQANLLSCFAAGGGDCDGYGCSYAMLHSNSQEQLYNAGSNHVVYRWVTISYGDDFENGGEEYKYEISYDQYGEIIWGFHNIMGSTKSNQSWNSGLELYNRKFKMSASGDTITVEETTTEYSYDTEERNKEITNGIVVRKKYDPICELDGFIPCDEGNINYYYNVSCSANHTHQWAFFPYAGCGGTVCIAQGANCNDTTWHVCHGHPIGDTIEIKRAIDHFDVMEYQIYSYWNYVDNKTVITYDENGENPITNTTHYFYDNEKHALLSRTILSDSNGDEIRTETYYPEDYNEGVANFDELINNKLMTALPIDQRTYRGGILVDDKITKYNDYGQPVEIYVAETELGTAHPFNPTAPYSFGVRRMNIDYDNDLNLISYHAEHNKPTSFVWGYDFTQVVAKIDNATYEDVMNTLLAINSSYTIEYLQSITGEALQDIFNALRAHPNMENAMIESYTHDPMVGLTSQTNPNGKTTWYEYDAFGRLETLRNDDHKVLKHVDYNYMEP